MLRSIVRLACRRGRAAVATACLSFALVSPLAAQGGAQPPTPPPAQEEFEPVTGVPPEEQLPAAPLVMGAYAFVWIVLIAYLWSVSRRLGKVQEELDRLDARLKRGA